MYLLITAHCNVPFLNKHFQCTSCNYDCSSNPAVDLKNEVRTTLSATGWNFSSTENTAIIFPAQVQIIDNGGYTLAIRHSHVTGRAPLWQLNYPALFFLTDGQYHSEYLGTSNSLQFSPFANSCAAYSLLQGTENRTVATYTFHCTTAHGLFWTKLYKGYGKMPKLAEYDSRNAKICI